MDFRVYQDTDQKSVLDLIRRSDSTSRRDDTWADNDMTASLAYDGTKLIGAIPFEPRNFSLGNADSINVLWVSGAHVEAEYRNKGIGRKLDEITRREFSEKYQAIFVYRQDENSRAYKWYESLGYYPLLSILALKKNTNSDFYPFYDFQCQEIEGGLDIPESDMFECFLRNGGNESGGSPNRYLGYWSKRLRAHCYKEHYKYFILMLTKNDQIISFVILGETKFKDNIERLEILEYCVKSDNQAQKELLSSVQQFAVERKVAEIRLQLSQQDSLLPWARELGFEIRWRSNIMGVIINLPALFDRLMNEYPYSISIETPGFGIWENSKGKKDLELFMSDNELTRMLFNRSDISCAVKEGRVLILSEACHDAFLQLNLLFPLNKWKYFQVDYI